MVSPQVQLLLRVLSHYQDVLHVMQADAMEAALQAENRRVQIERANKVLFDETDKVKTLHSKMLESDAIKENESLVAYKRQIEVLRKAQDAAFVEQQRQALEVCEHRWHPKLAMHVPRLDVSNNWYHCHGQPCSTCIGGKGSPCLFISIPRSIQSKKPMCMVGQLGVA